MTASMTKHRWWHEQNVNLHSGSNPDLDYASYRELRRNPGLGLRLISTNGVNWDNSLILPKTCIAVGRVNPLILPQTTIGGSWESG